MKRKEFLKLSSTLGIGAPFFLNGISARASSLLSSMGLPPLDCSSVNDRVLVIVRLAGANDGLNTIIPINQYAKYASLRPDIKIKDTGTGSFINLDSTLSLDKQTGLHPSLTGFKSLYDSGYLSLVNGVGYPSPNYSHFAAENLMFAGKDGTTTADVDDGLFGRYLSKAFPGMANNPNSLMKDPLALHLGSNNPSLFYNHSHDIGIEYNLTNLQSSLWSTPGFLTLPSTSEHGQLLDYINSIEQSMDVYYDRVLSVFNGGSNSALASYPNTDLGKQLKTVARMIKGGSKTKIFQVTLGGFDTHVNQIVTGATHTGSHATLLSNLASSIKAFQDDLVAMSLADRVMTTTFSEFGRQVKQNASLGTDHGDISPFFVIGKHVNAGVLGVHPTLPTTGFYYGSAERKHDYRQIYTTLLQDWLGADASVLTTTELDSFGTTSAKLPLVSSSVTAAPDCLKSSLIDCSKYPTDTVVTEMVYTDGGWTYYAPKGYKGNKFLFGIEHKPSGVGYNTKDFAVNVVFNKLICSPEETRVISVTQESLGEGTFVAGYYWNIQLISGSLDGKVNWRFFPISDYLTDLNTQAHNFKLTTSALFESDLLYAKTNHSQVELKSDMRADGKGFEEPIAALKINSTGSYFGYDYIQFNNVDNIINTGAFAFKRVTNMDQTKSNVPNAGTFRFNFLTKKFEGWDGSKWVTLH